MRAARRVVLLPATRNPGCQPAGDTANPQVAPNRRHYAKFTEGGVIQMDDTRARVSLAHHTVLAGHDTLARAR